MITSFVEFLHSGVARDFIILLGMASYFIIPTYTS